MRINYIISVLLIIFIFSCGEDEVKDKLLPCNPESSSITTGDIAGIWYADRSVMLANTCTDDDVSKVIDTYSKYEKVDDCRVKVTDCKDGVECKILDGESGYYILENNKFDRYEILKDEEIDEGCHVKQDSSLVINFHSSIFASVIISSNVLVDDECPEYLKNGRCYIKDQIDIQKVGEIK